MKIKHLHEQLKSLDNIVARRERERQALLVSCKVAFAAVSVVRRYAIPEHVKLHGLDDGVIASRSELTFQGTRVVYVVHGAQLFVLIQQYI